MIRSLLRELGIFKFDVALSFAEEQRAFVENVAAYLRAKGIRIFYDNDKRVHTWGKDLQHHLDHIYREGAQFCVMFISADYSRKRWSQFEQKRSLARAFFSKEKEYVLPFKFDDTEIHGLENTIAYLPASLYDEQALADAIIEKLETHRTVYNHLRLGLKWYFTSKWRTAALIAAMLLCVGYGVRDHLTPVDVLTERIHERSRHPYSGSACYDGTPSHSQGRGACSGHGGVEYEFEKNRYGKSLERCRKEAEEISWIK